MPTPVSSHGFSYVGRKENKGGDLRRLGHKHDIAPYRTTGSFKAQGSYLGHARHSACTKIGGSLRT